MFTDRKDAALHLAKALKKYKDVNAIVLGIPRGGAVTGYYVAKQLNATFSLIISRKLGHPANEEFAVGAVAEDGTLFLTNAANEEVTQHQIAALVAGQKKEIERRIKALRNGQPLPKMNGKVVIIVDDGIATGATLFAAVQMCRKLGAMKIVAAAPVSGESVLHELEETADEVIVLETPPGYSAVSEAYEDFPQVSDEEAAGLLENWQREKDTESSNPLRHEQTHY